MWRKKRQRARQKRPLRPTVERIEEKALPSIFTGIPGDVVLQPGTNELVQVAAARAPQDTRVVASLVDLSGETSLAVVDFWNDRLGVGSVAVVTPEDFEELSAALFPAGWNSVIESGPVDSQGEPLTPGAPIPDCQITALALSPAPTEGGVHVSFVLDGTVLTGDQAKPTPFTGHFIISALVNDSPSAIPSAPPSLKSVIRVFDVLGQNETLLPATPGSNRLVDSFALPGMVVESALVNPAGTLAVINMRDLDSGNIQPWLVNKKGQQVLLSDALEASWRIAAPQGGAQIVAGPQGSAQGLVAPLAGLTSFKVTSMQIMTNVHETGVPGKVTSIFFGGTGTVVVVPPPTTAATGTACTGDFLMVSWIPEKDKRA